jgi:hypothetical protein
MHSHWCTSSLYQKVIPPTASLSVTSHREQGQSDLSTHYHYFKRQCISLGLKPTLTRKQMTVMNAYNRVAIFAHSVDIMKPMLPHLLHTVYVSNSHWWHAVPTAAHNRVSICFHTFKVSIWHTLFIAHANAGCWYSSYMLQIISPHAICISEWDEDEGSSVPQVSTLLN